MKNSVFTYKLIETKEGFYNLSTEWNDLLCRSMIANPFLTWNWMYNWWDTYGDRISDVSLCIITVIEDERLVGILPGFIQVKSNTHTFFFLGSQFESPDYLEMIREKQKSDVIFIENSLNYLLSKRRIDVIAFNSVLKDSLFLRSLNQFVSNNRLRSYTRFNKVCPFIDINGSWDDFVEGLSKNMRYNLRRRTRKMQNEFQAEFQIVNSYDKVEQAIDEIFLLHQLWFTSRKKDDSFLPDLRKDFHKKIGQSLFNQDILRIFQLKVNDKIIAVLYCYEYANQLFFYQSGADPDWSKYSIGMVLLGYVIQYAHTKRLSRFDFLRGGEDYKFNWTNQSQLMGAVYIGVSHKGKIIVLKRTTYIQLKKAIKTLLRMLGIHF